MSVTLVPHKRVEKDSSKGMLKTYSQDQVNTMLRRGVIFSIIWLMGVGSAISIFMAVKAMRIINRSNGEIVGMGKVWWCFIVGGLGVTFWGAVIIMVIVNGAKG